MNKGKKWELLESTPFQDKTFTIEKLLQVILKNRGISSEKDFQDFLHPKLSDVTSKSVGLDQRQITKALGRLKIAKENKEKVAIFGDYDVDGITGTCILWETLYKGGWDASPYIPHRVEEGYGLSQKGIENLLAEKSEIKVIITVDNGIVANDAVDFAKSRGIDVIITDHHTLGEKLPAAYAVVHTTQLCGAGVGWMLEREIAKELGIEEIADHLALVALATVADLVPLQGANRTLLIEGLKLLRQTTRPGIIALCEEAQIKAEDISVYSIGHVIGPRLNAMGRMESAMDSLRLLCTKDRLKAKVYADTLGTTNRERQLLTQSLSEHAKTYVRDSKTIKNILFVANDSYEEGVIGLIAGKLVEEFYRPAIVIAKGEKVSKASARSVTGFNIIEFIRSASHLLINAGGHPMAAGFTLETEKIVLLQALLEEIAEKELHDGLLQRVLKIDCEVGIDIVSFGTYEVLQTLAPFGMGNAEPIFSSVVVVKDIRTVGQEGKHLKLVVSSKATQSQNYDAIAFNMGQLKSDLKSGDTIHIAYTIDMNIWNGKKNLQLKIRDIKKE